MAVKDTKNIFIFFSEDDINKALNSYGKENVSKGMCFAVNPLAHGKLLSLNIKAYQIESYFLKDKAPEIFSLTLKWSKDWYKRIKLNSCSEQLSTTELSLHNYFAKKLFQFLCLKQMIKNEKPRVIYLGREGKGLKSFLVTDFDSITSVVKKIAKTDDIQVINLNKFSLLDFTFVKILISIINSFRSYDWPNEKLIKTDYLFAAHHYHIVNVLPVLEKMLEREEIVVVGKIGEAKNVLERLGIPYIDLNKTNSTFSIKIIITNIRLYFLLFKLNSLKNYFKFRSTNFYEIFLPKLYSVIFNDVIKVLSLQKYSYRLFHYTDPGIFTCISEDSTIQTLLIQANKSSVPTFEIEHGFPVGSDSLHIHANTLAVWGLIPEKIYRDTGFINEIKITGWPAFEIYKNIKTKSFKVPTIQTITFLAQDPEGVSLLFMKKTPEQNLEIFFSAISELGSKVRVKVRLHPRASGAIVSAIARKYGVDFELSNNERESLKDLLEVTDIVVGQSTSATIDSILMHKPVIYLPSMEWPAEFVKGTGAVFTVDDSKTLTTKINQILKKGISRKMINEQNKFANNYCNFPDDSVNSIINQIRLISRK